MYRMRRGIQGAENTSTNRISDSPCPRMCRQTRCDVSAGDIGRSGGDIVPMRSSEPQNGSPMDSLACSLYFLYLQLQTASFVIFYQKRSTQKNNNIVNLSSLEVNSGETCHSIGNRTQTDSTLYPPQNLLANT